MAAITQTKTLAEILLNPASKQFGEHVWNDRKLGFVVGTFPAPRAQFDFAREKLVPIPGAIESKPVISMRGTARRAVQRYEFETAQAIFEMWSATQLLVEGLNLIERARPGTLERMAAQPKKQSKRPVAKTREELYDVKHPASHSAKLENGFYVATNNKAEESMGYLREATGIAGLAWDLDIIVRRG